MDATVQITHRNNASDYAQIRIVRLCIDTTLQITHRYNASDYAQIRRARSQFNRPSLAETINCGSLTVSALDMSLPRSPGRIVGLCSCHWGELKSAIPKLRSQISSGQNCHVRWQISRKFSDNFWERLCYCLGSQNALSFMISNILFVGGDKNSLVS